MLHNLNYYRKKLENYKKNVYSHESHEPPHSILSAIEKYSLGRCFLSSSIGVKITTYVQILLSIIIIYRHTKD